MDVRLLDGPGSAARRLLIGTTDGGSGSRS
jgi:hypothetical protein